MASVFRTLEMINRLMGQACHNKNSEYPWQVYSITVRY